MCQCRICGNSLDNTTHIAQEIMLGLRGEGDIACFYLKRSDD